MVFYLNDNDISFPDPALAEADGFLAIGGDLSTERLLSAYRNGIFPWYSAGEPICWYAPHERCVIFPADIHISRSMKKIIAQKKFTLTTNKAFAEIIAGCKETIRKDRNGTWITNEMEQAYIHLHQQGIAHSIEVWEDNTLVGGMYGVQINNVFCGESMFSKVSNASKAALIWLCTQTDYTMLDCQLHTEHLISMGAKMISGETYLEVLNK